MYHDLLTGPIVTLVTVCYRCSSLVYLTICFCDHISEAGIELLGQTSCIVSLDISGCHCSDQVSSVHVMSTKTIPMLLLSLEGIALCRDLSTRHWDG